MNENWFEKRFSEQNKKKQRTNSCSWINERGFASERC